MIDRRGWLWQAGIGIAAALWAAPARSAGIRRVVFVHGRGQQGKDPSALKAEWVDTLKKGAESIGRSLPLDVEVQFPFYGDVLDRFASQFDAPPVSEMQARGSAQDDEFLVFQAEFADALRRQAGITDAQVDAEYGPNPAPRGPLNWQWVQAILRAIDKNSPGMGQKTLEAFTRDVFLYVMRAGVRDAIDRIVSSALTEEPTVVVSHSLGTVVAYSVLRTDRRALQVPLLVTLGSPLAVRSVRDQFRPLGFPAPVGSWYNAFDTRDVVSLYPLDAENFPVAKPIQNNSRVRNHTDNRHGIVGYLDDSDVARRITDAIAA
jgi:pimeloyl-ACP methyl ester carboxylesterase